MIEPLYKAQVRYDAEAAMSVMGKLGNHQLTNDAILEYVEDRNHERAYPIYERAMAWLEDNGKADAFVNCYDNTDHLNGAGNIVFVFNDRSTAIMFKLALG